MPSKPSLLRERLREATTQEILDAAEAELAEHGLAATAMSSIAKRAGVSVGTLYNYFEDKDVLLTTLLADRRKRFAALLDEALAKHESLAFDAQLEAAITAVFDLFESHRNFLRIVLGNEKPASGNDAGPPRKTPVTQFVERLRPVTTRGVKSGALAAEDADLYPAALAALLRAVMIERLADASRPFHSATPFVMRLFLDGARTR
jgi:AcrR family transcriptional regulator